MSGGDYTGMTNHELAQNLLDAEKDGDTDNIIYCENEIVDRLNLDADETELGLTRDRQVLPR